MGARQMTVSTVGLVPQIQRLAKEDIHVELAVSLHAASDRIRSVLVPVNRRYPLGKLIPACQEYLQATGRRPTFEYALFNGMNDSLDQAQKLVNLLAGFECHVNLIVGNPTPSKDVPPLRGPAGGGVSEGTDRGRDLQHPAAVPGGRHRGRLRATAQPPPGETGLSPETP